jgi:hypothetical protein
LARTVIRFGTQAGVLRRLRAGNLMISNVPGPTFPLYFAGMRMEAVHPLGPVIDGVALNITVQSYCESLFVGINACATAVPDLPGLSRSLVSELAHLRNAAAASGPALGQVADADSAAATPPEGTRSVPGGARSTTKTASPPPTERRRMATPPVKKTA